MTDFPVVPGCKILGKIGKGSLAKVFLGTLEKLNRKVAIKLFESSLIKDKEIAARLEREIKTTADLSHSNIVQIYAVGRTDYYYMVMEYLDESLKDIMNRNTGAKIPPEIALDIIDNIMKALDYLHQKGLSHRDIKPGNIMFKPDRTPVLTDFGIARVFDTPGPPTGSEQDISTAYYLSPELCSAQKDIDGRSDIYSLGVVLFEMLTGKKPYDMETRSAIILQHIEGPIPALPRELSQYQPLIDKMMAKDKENRLTGRSEFTDLLDNIQASSENTSPQPGESPTSSEQTKNRDFTFKKPTNPLKSLFDNFLKSIKKNLGQFINQLMKKLDPIMNKPIMKKIILVVLPSLVILAMISIIIFYKGYQEPANQSQQSGNPFPVIERAFTQAPVYHAKFNRAQELFNKGDLNSLKYVRGLINELKEIAIIPELLDLEIKTTERINTLNQEFQSYFEAVTEYYKKSNYKKAREFILKAKEINPYDKDIVELEHLVEEAIKKRNP